MVATGQIEEGACGPGGALAQKLGHAVPGNHQKTDRAAGLVDPARDRVLVGKPAAVIAGDVDDRHSPLTGIARTCR
ncbi:MAG: hypothetical protein WDO24_11720 [Pseudomonadota bacterium]